MIISEKFVIGHIPKTGGHALAVMLSKISSLDFISPFAISKGRAKIVLKDETLHAPLESLDKHQIDNKDIILVIRRLPAWWYSILWHHSIHTRINEKIGVEKYRVRDVYDSEFKQKQPSVLLIPEITCKTTYPDSKLHEIGGNYLYRNKTIWFKMETLAEDLLNYLIDKNIKITGEETDLILNVGHNHSYKTCSARLRYYSNRDLEILYENNPLWSKVEQILYGNILQEIE